MDFYIGLCRRKRRALEAPAVMEHRLSERHMALELTAACLLYLRVIIDFRKVQLNGVKVFPFV